LSREPAADQGQIREYLLRNLAEADRARFEESYFTDDALLDRIEAEEDLLVSDYVLGRLSEEDRIRFENALLATPYYRERVETTTRLRLRIARDQGVRRLGRSAAPGAGGGLFPGRTGIIVAFALLGVLLLASLVTALRLKEQLVALRSELNAPAPAAVTAGAGGVVPATPAIVLTSPAGEGICARRVERAAGSALVLVFPRALAPSGARVWRVVLRADTGVILWDSGDQPVPEGAAADLAVRLPAGVPEEGSSGVTLWADGSPVLSTLLEIAAPPLRPSR
jgi:hypothetical protein